MENSELLNKQQIEKELERLNPQNIEPRLLPTEGDNIALKVTHLQMQLKGINDRIRLQEITHERNNQNLVRNILGVNFEDSINYASENPGMAQKINKTPSQLRKEYQELNKRLDAKIDNGEISDEQYDNVSVALYHLYNSYKQNNIKEQNKVAAQNKEEVVPEKTEVIDENLEGLRNKYGYYTTMSEHEREMFDNRVTQELYGEKEIDKVETQEGKIR